MNNGLGCLQYLIDALEYSFTCTCSEHNYR